ncbi:TraB/GumN family protein [Bacteroidota bacterium]
MKRKFNIITFFIFLFYSFCSVTAESKYDIEELNSFFWKAKSETSTVYMFGSIHLAREDMYPLPENIETAFENSDALVVEVDLNKANPIELMQRAMYKDERTLKSELSEETYNKIHKLLLKYEVPQMIYLKMKPWMAVITVLMMQLQEKGFDESMGIDKYFMDKAIDKKEILQLESAEAQLNLLDTEFDKLSDEFVRYSLMDNDNMIEQVDTMVLYWKEGNYKAMDKLALEIPGEFPEFQPIMDKLYTERNIKMVGKIEEYLKTDKTYFVVVGAAHLIGKDGIINLLIEK